MSLTLRNTKGLPLTYAEADANFSGLADGSLITALPILSSTSSPLEGDGLVGHSSNLIGSVGRTVQQEIEDGVVSLKRFGAYCDDSHDDTAAWALAAAALGDTSVNLRSGLQLIVPGPSCIGDTALFTKLSIVIEGRGWGYRTDDNARRSYVRWIGAAGSPMFKFVDCFGGLAVRNINLKGLSTAKPSAAIELNEGAATGVPNTSITLDNVRIGSFAGETDAGTQFTSGIVFTGTNNNSEHRFNGVYISGCSSYGIKQCSIQNLNIKADHLTIAQCGTGAYVTGHLHGSGWNFSQNTIDFEIPATDTDGSSVNALITVHNYYSELAGRMLSVTAAAAYRFHVIGGQFQISSSLNADGKIVIDEGNTAGAFHLDEFRFTQSTAPPASPMLSLRSSAAGAGERRIILDGISGWANLTGGTYGLNVASRGPTDRTYIYFRENAQSASGTPAHVSQNFLQGLNVDWDTNRFHVRNDTGLKMMEDFTGVALDTNKWVGRVGSDGSCVTPFIVSGVHGGAMRAATGASATADMATNGFLLRGEAHWISNLGGLSFEARIKPPASITSLAFFCGFTSSLGTGALANSDMPFTLVAGALTSNAVDGCGILFDTSATAGTVWHLVGVANNVDATTQNLAVGPTVNTNVTLRIDLSNAGVATFSINGAVVGTTMTGAVTSSVALAPVVCGFRRGAASSTFNYDYVSVECNRSL